MTGANVFLPLFHPTTDTFEAVRQRSGLYISAVLTVALAVTMPKGREILAGCVAKCQALAGRMLFSMSPGLEDFRGLLVLATYAEENWFAVNHALEMANNMNLWDSLSRLLVEQEHGGSLSVRRQLTRTVRASLVLHNVEREVATGVARRSRLRSMEKCTLRSFLDSQFSLPSDVRIVSIIEMTQLRGEMDAILGRQLLT
jgi:hypothetical protein